MKKLQLTQHLDKVKLYRIPHSNFWNDCKCDKFGIGFWFVVRLKKILINIFFNPFRYYL